MYALAYLFFWLAAMFLLHMPVYFTAAHVQLLAKNMAATHVHAICTRNHQNALPYSLIYDLMLFSLR